MSSIIASKAVLATLNVGAWRTVKRHKQETQAENARHGLNDEARVDVKICANAHLESILKLFTEARQDHYRLTMPAADDGLRLLPGSRQFEHSQTMQRHASRYNAMLDLFAADYANELNLAPSRLKGLYVPSQWPDVSVVRSKFRFSVNYLPVPAMPGWDEWLAESAEMAREDVKARFADVLGKLSATLADPKKRFWDSLVTNVRDVLDVADDLNISGDPQITQLAQMSRELAKVDPDTLREDPVVRKDVAARAADLCSMFNLS